MGKNKRFNDEYSHLTHEEKMVMTIAEIVQYLIKAHDMKQNVDLNVMKKQIASKYHIKSIPRLVDIIAAVPSTYRKALVPKLLAKPIRTASGIAVVAVMCKPHRCPHINWTGNICVYCPGGPDSDFEYSTQSYTGYEPTSMRAIRARYDPYLQVRHRVEQLKQLGHTVEKVEFIIMGGTFMSLPEEYRENFIVNLHDALSGNRSSNLKEAIYYSERSNTKCIGITIETRPDYCLERHLNDMLNYGCTRLEIGLQSIYEDVARDTNRGHTVKAVCDTMVLAKNAGFKIVTHMMPNLPNLEFDDDLEQFAHLFENPDFRPDGLKIYPTLVIRGTGLYELWKSGRYKSYPPTDLIDLIANILSMIPPWVRVYRVQRDIPMPLVSSGVEHGNLRELALGRMKDLGLKCRDVRTREVGIVELHEKVVPEDVEFVRRDYVANNGWESFLSFEDPQKDILVGLLRLRKCNWNKFDPSLLQGGVSVVRELHVYGSVVPIHDFDFNKQQHKGYGIALMQRAEQIAMNEHLSDKISIISGVGTRNYYRLLGYELEGTYMVKSLKKGEYIGALDYSDMRGQKTIEEFKYVNVPSHIINNEVLFKQWKEKYETRTSILEGKSDEKLKYITTPPVILNDEKFLEPWRKKHEAEVYAPREEELVEEVESPFAHIFNTVEFLEPRRNKHDAEVCTPRKEELAEEVKSPFAQVFNDEEFLAQSEKENEAGVSAHEENPKGKVKSSSPQVLSDKKSLEQSNEEYGTSMLNSDKQPPKEPYVSASGCSDEHECTPINYLNLHSETFNQQEFLELCIKDYASKITGTVLKPSNKPRMIIQNHLETLLECKLFSEDGKLLGANRKKRGG